MFGLIKDWKSLSAGLLTIVALQGVDVGKAAAASQDFVCYTHSVDVKGKVWGKYDPKGVTITALSFDLQADERLDFVGDGRAAIRGVGVSGTRYDKQGLRFERGGRHYFGMQKKPRGFWTKGGAFDIQFRFDVDYYDGNELVTEREGCTVTIYQFDDFRNKNYE